jgi:uncharacterized protein
MGMSRVFWDTNLFIYFLEGNDRLSLATRQLRESMLVRGDQLFTSAITLGEVLIKPLERGDRTLCTKYEEIVTRSATLIPFEASAARQYAAIRADRSLRAPDALQLACAASVKLDLFVTNDYRLQGKRVPGIQFIVPLERVPI